MIKDKAMLNLVDEVYDMKDGGTFTSPDGAVRRLIPVACIVALNSGDTVAGTNVAGTSVIGVSVLVIRDGPNAVSPSLSRRNGDSSRKRNRYDVCHDAIHERREGT